MVLVVQYRLLFLSSLVSTNCRLLCQFHDTKGANCQTACVTNLTCVCVHAGSGDGRRLWWRGVPNSSGVWAFHCWFRRPQRTKVNIPWCLLQTASCDCNVGCFFALSTPLETGMLQKMWWRRVCLNTKARCLVMLFIIIASAASSLVPTLYGAKCSVKLASDWSIDLYASIRCSLTRCSLHQQVDVSKLHVVKLHFIHSVIQCNVDML